MLDGLDEVSPACRELLRESIMSAIRHYKVERVIVTCRVLSYTGDARLDGFDDFQLAGFTGEQIRSFAHRWYLAQVRLKAARFTRARAEELGQALAEAALREDLRELAENPLLMTTMAIVHQRADLPRDRVLLFKRAIEVLLLRWQEHKMGRGNVTPSQALGEVLSDQSLLVRCMEGLAYAAHCARRDMEFADLIDSHSDRAGLLRGDALRILEGDRYLRDAGLASEFLDYVDKRAGLLLGRGGGDGKPDVYGFPHRQFQEYLAGCYLAGHRFHYREYAVRAKEGDFWSQAALLGAEELMYGRGETGRNFLLELIYQLERCGGDEQQIQRAVLWSGTYASMLGGTEIAQDFESGGPDYLESIKPKLINVIAGSLPSVERAAAGCVLGRLGDDRVDVLSLDGMRFCHVPAGPGWMGAAESDELATADEKPGGLLPLDYAYWIGRYPISNAQFSLFADAGGYTDARWWEEAIREGLWTEAGLRVNQDPDTSNVVRPLVLPGPLALANYPVVAISWYEALAYARWLTHLANEKCWLPMGWLFRLPNEPEWEKAARGGQNIPSALGDGRRLTGLATAPDYIETVNNPYPQRRYPWGDDADSERLNVRQTNIQATNALGCFPRGCSPYGCLELGGNVWEWTRSLWSNAQFELDYPYPYSPDDGREDPFAPSASPRVVRGGSWHNGHRYARVSSRGWYLPSYRRDNLGFRLVAAPPPGPSAPETPTPSELM